MGVDINLDIGPYLYVEGEVTDIIETSVRTCSNNKCEIHKNNKVIPKGEDFCSKCGESVKIKKYSYEHTTSARGFVDELIFEDDRFIDELRDTDPMCGESNIFIPNRRTPFDKVRAGKDFVDIAAEDLINVDINAEIKWFKEEYEEIISLVEEKFGKGSAKVGWGVLQWYS